MTVLEAMRVLGLKEGFTLGELKIRVSTSRQALPSRHRGTGGIRREVHLSKQCL